MHYTDKNFIKTEILIYNEPDDLSFDPGDDSDKKKGFRPSLIGRHENMWRSIGRQEEPAIVNSRLLLRMRRVYVASIRLYFH